MDHRELLQELQQRIWTRGDLPFAHEATLVVNAAHRFCHVRLKFLNAVLPVTELDFYIPAHLELIIRKSQKDLTAEVPVEYALKHMYFDGEVFHYHYSLKNSP